MEIKRFEKIENNNDYYYLKCADIILDVFGDFLTISDVKFLDDVEYNFQCVVRSISKESYSVFKMLFDIIDKHSNDFIYSNSECFAKIVNINDFCDEIKNIEIL